MDGLPVPVNVAVVGIGADDAAMRTAIERLAALGHKVLGKQQLAIGAPLLEVLTSFVEDADVDVVLAIANDPEPVREALAPMISRSLPGFAELLRAAAFAEIGSSAMLLDGEAARCGETYVFVVPGTVGAVKVALEHLLIPQLDSRTRPSNLASKLKRTRMPTPAPAAAEAVTTPEAPADVEMIRSDAAILIPPAEIVPDAPPPAVDTVAPAGGAEQLDFVKSLEQHAQKIRAEKSQVGPLPTPPPRASKTQPPPLKTQPPPMKTQPPPIKDAAPTDDAPAAPRKKNETTPQQWAKAAEDLEKISPAAARPDGGSLGSASTVLEKGDRVIVIPRHKKRRTWLWVPIALAVGAAGAVAIKTQFLSGDRTASAEPQPQPEQVVKVESVEQLPSPPEQPPRPAPAMPTLPAPEQPQEIEMEGAGNLTALAQAHAIHHTGSAAALIPTHAGSATEVGSAVGSDAPDPRTHPGVAPASPDCDEASCILERYKRECCARYKPAEMPAEQIAPAGPPETLDKAAVKAGIADLKPAIQQCGEEHYAKGTVKITLTVTADGRVTDATVGETPLPELGSCVAKVLERATFSKTQNGAVFTYPFMF